MCREGSRDPHDSLAVFANYCSTVSVPGSITVTKSVVVVVSPLVSLMVDLVTSLVLASLVHVQVHVWSPAVY